MKQTTIQVFSDPGHAWARVSRKRLVDLGIADKVSMYSYEKNNQVFLEEDCDLSHLITALKQRGYEVKFKVNNSNRTSKIRNYCSYRLV